MFLKDQYKDNSCFYHKLMIFSTNSETFRSSYACWWRQFVLLNLLICLYTVNNEQQKINEWYICNKLSLNVENNTHFFISQVKKTKTLWFSHGGIKEKEKQLWKTAVFWQLVFSTRELWKTSVIRLVFKYYIQRFIQTNFLSR